MLETTVIDCPYCGERIELVVDPSAGDQDYIEDCEVCCRPLAISLAIDGRGEIVVSPRTEND